MTPQLQKNYHSVGGEAALCQGWRRFSFAAGGASPHAGTGPTRVASWLLLGFDESQIPGLAHGQGNHGADFTEVEIVGPYGAGAVERDAEFDPFRGCRHIG